MKIVNANLDYDTDAQYLEKLCKTTQKCATCQSDIELQSVEDTWFDIHSFNTRWKCPVCNKVNFLHDNDKRFNNARYAYEHEKNHNDEPLTFKDYVSIIGILILATAGLIGTVYLLAWGIHSLANYL